MKPNEYESECGMCPYCGSEDVQDESECGMCPYCGSEDVQVLCDGTCRCLECGSIWK